VRVLRRPRRESLSGPFFKDLFTGARNAATNALDMLAYMERNGGFFIRKEIAGLRSNLAILPTLTAFQAVQYILGPLEYERGMRSYCDWSGSDFEEALDHVQAISLLPPETAPAAALLDLAADPPKPKKERDKTPKNGVCLTTGHSAKGLEWKNPIIIGVVEANHPFTTSNGSEDIEPARRLFYVMMTRAVEELDIYVPLQWRGRQIDPSPFLYEAGLVKDDPKAPKKPMAPPQFSFEFKL